MFSGIEVLETFVQGLCLVPFIDVSLAFADALLHFAMTPTLAAGFLQPFFAAAFLGFAPRVVRLVVLPVGVMLFLGFGLECCCSSCGCGSAVGFSAMTIAVTGSLIADGFAEAETTCPAGSWSSISKMTCSPSASA